jgi:hypothetical protein
MTQFANPGAALGEGLNSGADFASKIIGASRDRTKYRQQQSAQQAAGDAIQNVASSANDGGEPGDEAQNAQAHSSFLQSLGQGLSHIGTGINNFFSGGQGAGLPPQPGTAPAVGGAPGAVAMPAGPNPQAAPVGLPQAPGAPTMGVAGGAPAFMQNGGPVRYYQNGGPVATGAEPRAYLEDGGPVPQTGLPNPGAALGLGLNQGAQAGQAIVDNARAGQQFGQDQDARKAAGNAVENFAAHLHGAGLDDTDTPNHAAPGHPAYSMAQNPQQLVMSVAQDSRAQQGLPEKGTSQPHSITPEWWDHNDKMMAHAAAMAAYAGHDPDQVFQSLNHMRTSFVQGHMLRAASAASVALQNGDMKAVEQNLRNMNYYLPDGKDLTIQKDADGNLMYQNPLQQFVDAQGNPTDSPKGPDGKPNRPNMVPVDQAHIQLLGQAILDPMKVNDTLMATRAAVAKQRLEAAQTQAQLNNSTARLMIGKARYGEMPAINYRNLSQGDLDRAKAATAGYALSRWRATLAQQKLDPSLLRGAGAAAAAVDDALLGPKTSVPVSDKNGDPSLSPAAGKTVHDSTRVPKELQNVDALEAGEMKAVAGDIFIANAHTGMSPTQAAQYAIQIRNAGRQSHKGPDGKTYPNAYIHRESGEAGIWDGKQYRKFRIGQQSAAGLLDNGGRMPEQAFISAGLGGGGNGGAAAGGPSDNEEGFVLGNDNG